MSPSTLDNNIRQLTCLLSQLHPQLGTPSVSKDTFYTNLAVLLTEDALAVTGGPLTASSYELILVTSDGQPMRIREIDLLDTGT